MGSVYRARIWGWVRASEETSVRFGVGHPALRYVARSSRQVHIWAGGTAMTDRPWFLVTLREWLESQRLENTPHRAALNKAMNEGDIAAIRGFLNEAPFSADQRRYLDDLLNRWEAAEGKDPG